MYMNPIEKSTGKQRIIFTSITLFLMLAIFLFSSQDAEASSALSDFIARFLHIATDNDRPSEVKLIFGLTLRKFGHLSEFFLLGMSMLLTVRAWFVNAKLPVNAALSLVFCYAYACLDELHQAFVPGRGPMLRDTFIDGTGSLIGIAIVFVFLCLRGKRIQN